MKVGYNRTDKATTGRWFQRMPGTEEGWKYMEITDRIWTGPDCYYWREVFAYLPVQTISGKYVWLRKIYKRRYWAVWGQSFHMEPQVEYGELFDVLIDNQLT